MELAVLAGERTDEQDLRVLDEAVSSQENFRTRERSKEAAWDTLRSPLSLSNRPRGEEQGTRLLRSRPASWWTAILLKRIAATSSLVSSPPSTSVPIFTMDSAQK